MIKPKTTSNNANTNELRIRLLMEASEEFCELLISCAISTREASRRGWIIGAQKHGLEIELCLKNLIQTINEAVELVEKI